MRISWSFFLLRIIASICSLVGIAAINRVAKWSGRLSAAVPSESASRSCCSLSQATTALAMAGTDLAKDNWI